MPWVRINESQVGYNLNCDSPNVIVNNGVVVSDGSPAAGFNWDLVPDQPVRIGVSIIYSEAITVDPETVQLGGLSTSEGTLVAFELAAGQVQMAEAGTTDSPAYSTTAEVAALDFATCTDALSDPVLSRYNIAVFFWEESTAVSYNCECDDEYPTKTLAQMREYLMIRLGWGAMVSTPLPGVAVTLNSLLRDAQEQIYRQYKVFRLERFFTWQLLTGVRFYDLPENEDVCTKKLDPRMITWVGISEGDNFWRQLVCGIKPEFYYGDISSWPTHYEIRQCIEVWPPPSSDDWKLRIKGYFGLLPLEEDTDVNTIDYEAIQLFALANAKAHYGQPDAANYMGQYRDYIGAVTAGSHHTRRYVPNTEQSYPPPLPVLTGWPGDP